VRQRIPAILLAALLGGALAYLGHAVEPRVKVVVNAHFDRATSKLVFKYPDGKPFEGVKLSLNDVVRVSVTSEFGNRPITIDKWEALETWREEKKEGKNTIQTDFSQPHEEFVYGRLGDQIKITAAFAPTEAAESAEVKPGAPAERTIARPEARVLLAGAVTRSQPPMAPSRGTWKVAPHRVDPYSNNGQHWATVTITVQR
jgi:hypothetical protein